MRFGIYLLPTIVVFLNHKPQEEMKTFTSLLVSRLFTLVFTAIFIFSAVGANAFNGTLNIPGIEYASLTASATENGVFINWVTVAEKNNSHFEVERSTDMKAFKTVAMVLDGFSATGTNGKSYKFKEAAGEFKKTKTVYYRLKQIDNDNQVHYSTVMAVQMNAAVTVIPKNDVSNSSITLVNIFFQPGYTNNPALLSKQSTISTGKNRIPVASTAGILSACEIIFGTEFTAPKLSVA